MFNSLVKESVRRSNIFNMILNILSLNFLLAYEKCLSLYLQFHALKRKFKNVKLSYWRQLNERSAEKKTLTLVQADPQWLKFP